MLIAAAAAAEGLGAAPAAAGDGEPLGIAGLAAATEGEALL